jgi:hypothetical protein
MSKFRGEGFLCMLALVLFIFYSRANALSDGYILCGAYGGTSTVLIDKDGKIRHTWQHSNLPDSTNGYSCYLLDNGNLLRSAQAPAAIRVNANAAPRQGVIDEIDPTGNLVWTYTLANDTFMLHHDMKPMSNGNILCVTFTVESKARMIALGVDTMLLKGSMGGMGAVKSILAEKIIEIKPKKPSGADIVWEWKVFDHVVRCDSAAAHPELFSGSICPALYYGQWMHLNGIDYNKNTDQIVFSSRIFSECYVIDHSTTTQQAASHTGGNRGKGGDLLYRWGKPANYKTSGGYVLECLHCPTWIPDGYPGAGNILFFHNNIGSLNSQAVEIAPPRDGSGNFIRTAGAPFGPEQPTWKFAPIDSSFYCEHMSSALRMPNGNTLTHEAYPPDTNSLIVTSVPKTNSRIREVTKEGQVTWEYYVNLQSQAATPTAKAFNPAKIMYYPSNYAGITNLLAKIPAAAHDNGGIAKLAAQVRVIQMKGRIDFTDVSGCEIGFFSLQGQKVASASPVSANFSFDTQTLPSGVYCVNVTAKNLLKASRKVTVMP